MLKTQTATKKKKSKYSIKYFISTNSPCFYFYVKLEQQTGEFCKMEKFIKAKYR